MERLNQSQIINGYKTINYAGQELYVSAAGIIISEGKLLKPYTSHNKGLVVYINSTPYSIALIVRAAFGLQLNFSNHNHQRIMSLYNQILSSIN